MKIFVAFLFAFLGISNAHISGGGGGCGGYGPALPPPPPPGPCGPRPFYPPPIATPCQPRPFYPPPPPPPPPPQSPYPAFGYPCQQPYGPQFQQQPSNQLPPLFQPPRVYPEIPPEEYLRLINEQKLIKETLIKKNLPDPFEDAKRPIPIIPEKYYPESRPIPIPSELPQPGMGCGGYFAEQQFRPYPPYGPYFRPPIGPYPQSPYPPPPLPPQNCCTRCGGCRSKAFGQKIANLTEETTENKNGVKKELECNNEKLKEIMEKAYSLPLKSAKSVIHESAEAALGHSIQVICSEHDFDYIVRSSHFCQVELEKGICYAFKTG